VVGSAPAGRQRPFWRVYAPAMEDVAPVVANYVPFLVALLWTIWFARRAEPF